MKSVCGRWPTTSDISIQPTALAASASTVATAIDAANPSNNVPSARLLKSKPVKTATPWRVRTKPIRDLIPEGFLDAPSQGEDGPEKIAELIPATHADRTGITIGKHRVSSPPTQPKL